ncbi:CACTA en-spm transposon protein [Cucumis melo var. makuwa]|uniref:CACTA en-spm transposon protein n=1 Tax=Cucumis melo var. makuwa TaxID=1194695 RepID=A0A5A7UJ50_CUCMM|nr:CACTA en-spm transposon protein [Cucumis melo var. makuwa]
MDDVTKEPEEVGKGKEVLEEAIDDLLQKEKEVLLEDADVPPKYIEIVKDHALNRFIEYQILTSLKEYNAMHIHFKKCGDSEQAHAKPPTILKNRLEEWNVLCDHYRSQQFHKQSRTNKENRGKQSYNHNSISKSFLQRKSKLSEERGELVECVELFKETHANRSGKSNVIITIELTPEGSQPLLGMKYPRQFWVDDQTIQKVLVRAPNPSQGRSGSSASSLVAQEMHTREVMELRNRLERSQS